MFVFVCPCDDSPKQGLTHCQATLPWSAQHHTGTFKWSFVCSASSSCCLLPGSPACLEPNILPFAHVVPPLYCACVHACLRSFIGSLKLSTTSMSFLFLSSHTLVRGCIKVWLTVSLPHFLMRRREQLLNTVSYKKHNVMLELWKSQKLEGCREYSV